MSRVGKVIVKPGYTEEAIYDTCAERKEHLLGYARVLSQAIMLERTVVIEEMCLRIGVQAQQELYKETPLLCLPSNHPMSPLRT